MTKMVYIATLMATKQISTTWGYTLSTKSTWYMTSAENLAEATGKAYAEAVRRYPQSDGYNSPGVEIEEFPQNAIAMVRSCYPESKAHP